MKLSKEAYVVSRATLEKVLAALAAHHTESIGDGQEDNCDDVIEADELLSAEIKAQNHD